MTSAKRIFIRDSIFNVFRRKIVSGKDGAGPDIYASISEIWTTQSDATKSKFSERDFLDVIGDLVSVGSLRRFASDLAIKSDAKEIVEPDYRAFCRAIFGRRFYLDFEGNGRYAVTSYTSNTDYPCVKLVPTRSAASSYAKEHQLYVWESHGYNSPCECFDLLNPHLGPGESDLERLAFEIWSNKSVQLNESEIVLEGGAR
jgi:hypothetical protein